MTFETFIILYFSVYILAGQDNIGNSDTCSDFELAFGDRVKI